MKNIVLIDGSPKINEASTSQYLIEALSNHIKETTSNKYFINARRSLTRHTTAEDFTVMANADAVIIAFPLYIFCLPGMLMRFLEDYYQFYLESGRVRRSTRVYAIVNCGFPEPEINLEAVRVIKSFSRHINADFRFGLLIGSGGMLREAKDAPFMKKTLKKLDEALATITSDIESNDVKEMDNINITVNFPRRLYFFMGHRGWMAQARKNGLKKQDLYRKPYR